MFSKLRQKLGFKNYRSAWLVAGAFILFILFGLIWRGLYLHFIEAMANQQQQLDKLLVKSELIEDLIISARDRSVIMAQFLFGQQNSDTPSSSLLKTYNDKANKITASKNAYMAIADGEEKRLLNQHTEITTANRAQQDYIMDLIAEGEYALALNEYTAQALPVQEQALDVLNDLHQYVAQQRSINKQQIDNNVQQLLQIVRFSTLVYSLLLMAVAGFVVSQLVKSRRIEQQLQQALTDRLLETTEAYKQADQDLIQLARYDRVTNLLNRYAFEQSLQAALSASCCVSLLFIDLDNFKWFNDILGHAKGDELLRYFAEQLTREPSPLAQATIARLGGDEFAILLIDASTEDEKQVIDFILATVAEIDAHYGPAKTLNASIGVARYPEHADLSDELIRLGDMAMYQAKALGKGRAEVVTAGLLQAIYDEAALEKALKEALQAKAIQVFYQAQYHLSDLTLSGAEALVRWQRDGHWVSPAVMIPLAEKTGLIHALGLHVFETVLHEIQQWDAQSLYLPRVAVNVSPIQMRLENSQEQLLARIDANTVDRERIEIEITESTFVDGEVFLSFIQQLEQRQIRIALDDFGTGYSSLSQITKLKIDTLKIDQSFVAQLEHSESTRVLVKTIIMMGHNLGLTVLAEGIETRDQFEMLKAWGCDEGQGYLFARPVPAEQFSFAPLVLG